MNEMTYPSDLYIKVQRSGLRHRALQMLRNGESFDDVIKRVRNAVNGSKWRGSDVYPLVEVLEEMKRRATA